MTILKKNIKFKKAFFVPGTPGQLTNLAVPNPLLGLEPWIFHQEATDSKNLESAMAAPLLLPGPRKNGGDAMMG